MKANPWSGLLTGDPTQWLLESDDPAARWVALTSVLDLSRGDKRVLAAHGDVLRSAAVADLVRQLPDWERPIVASGHDSPAYAPNLLNLLADMGVAAGDFARIEGLLDQMLVHQDDMGRFHALAAPPGAGKPAWGTLACDHHVITEVLLRFGRGEDTRVKSALAVIAGDMTRTAQGSAWLCLPDPVSGFRGPGRKSDLCPQVTLEALRLFSLVPARQRPRRLSDAARVVLRAWRLRRQEKPYQFGHGRRFKTVKWPPTWYRAYEVLDALGRYPGLWRGDDARPADRKALAEIAACLVAYNTGPDGRLTPKSASRGFERFSFGQKKTPSPFATALLLAVLHRLDDIAPLAAKIDVAALSNSSTSAPAA